MEWSGATEWTDIHTFRYVGLHFDWMTGTARFDFAHEGASQRQEFTETITFPLPENGLEGVDVASFEGILELLFLASGTVYYKAIAPRRIDATAVALAPAAVRWAEQLYHHGLAEFAVEWGIEHILDVPVATRYKARAAEVEDLGESGREPLVAIGGGKDSIVALEVLKSASFVPATFTMSRDEPGPQLAQVMAMGPGKTLDVRRVRDPELGRMESRQAARPGHAPATALNSLAGIAVATLHRLGPLVLANERSADEGNLVWRDREVNHQWAKSAAAESSLDEALREQAGIGSACFSLLSGMSELQVCRSFASIDGYDDLVASCNTAVRMPWKYSDPTARWCLECDKCRWVFLAFAVFMSRSRLLTIFGVNLLEDPVQLHEGYRELVGLAGHKPFECVGEIVEAQLAVELLAATAQWQDATVISALAAELAPVPPAAAAQVWRVDPARAAPAAYQAALDQWTSALAPFPQGGS